MKTYIVPSIRYWPANELNRIAASMSGGGSLAEGTESNPEIIQNKKEVIIYGVRQYWLACSINGAMTFSFSATNDIRLVLYRKKLVGKEVLRDITGINGEGIIYSLDEISNGSNTYYIQLLGKKTGTTTVAFEMKQQIDTFSSPTGAIWTPYSDTAIPSVYPAVLYYNKWFVDKTMVSYVVDMVSKSDFLDYQTKFVNGMLSVSQFVIGLWSPFSTALYNTLYAFVTGASAFIINLKNPINFK